MNMKILLGVVAVSALIILVALINPTISPYYDVTTTDFGNVGLGVVLVFDDNTTQNLKILQESKLQQMLAVYSLQGKKLTSIQYILKAKASGSGQSSVHIKDASPNPSITFTVDHLKGKGTKILTTGIPVDKTIKVDNKWYTIKSYTFSMNFLDKGLSKYYVPCQISPITLCAKLTGKIQYKEGSTWKTVTLSKTVKTALMYKNTLSGASITLDTDFTTA